MADLNTLNSTALLNQLNGATPNGGPTIGTVSGRVMDALASAYHSISQVTPDGLFDAIRHLMLDLQAGNWATAGGDVHAIVLNPFVISGIAVSALIGIVRFVVLWRLLGPAYFFLPKGRR